VLLLVGIVWCLCSASFAQSPRKDVSAKPAEKVIIDTDIGDDIDDAFAIALAVKSPEIEILGVTTTFGDTEARARIAGRLLAEVDRPDISVVAGVPTKTDNVMTQRRYGEGGRFGAGQPGGAVEFILQEIKKYPGEITLVGIGPLMNVAAVIDKDLETFRKLKRVVIMGGSIDCGYGELWFCPQHGPDAEWNIARDVAAAQKLFTSRVPLYVMPLDSTQLRFVETMRAYVFRQGTPMTDALTLLYHQWGQSTPTLFDPVTIAFLIDPNICPVVPMRIRVDDQGFTRREAGEKNAQVCMKSNEQEFFHLLIDRISAKQ
jgi:inosine-uridine nucleoside N-ribohydrolase